MQKIQNNFEIVKNYTGNVSKKFQKDISFRTGDINIFVYFQEGSKSTNRLTDIQEIQNDLELVQKHPGYVSRRFQKDISSRTKDINSLVN